MENDRQGEAESASVQRPGSTAEKYSFTVDELRKILAEISEGGNGRDIVVIKCNMINGYKVTPIAEIGGGEIKVGDNQHDRERINEDGEGFVFLASVEMLPSGFWRDQLSQ